MTAVAVATPVVRERPILFGAPMIRALLSGRKTQTRRILDLKKLSVTLPREVRADFSEFIQDSPPLTAPGRHRATLNQNGAVSVVQERGNLGVKPGEFDFVCPYADGVTRIRGDRSGWEIIPHPGQRLWVRETWASDREQDDVKPSRLASDETVIYLADGVHRGAPAFPGKTRPGIFMPHWASRLTLEVAGVRVERLHAITEDDALDEGVAGLEICGAKYGDERGCQHQPTTCARCVYALLWDSINGFNAWNANPWVWAVSFRVVSQ